jgi:para-nitrobenzyl esterase
MPVIDTRLGRIEGKQGDGCLAFLGIPYAQAPLGELRFKPPRPYESWADTLDATAFGASAPQPVMGGEDGPLQMPVEPTDVDCLFLNIYTPGADSGARPVMFWIHGGGYVGGSGRAYNGAQLAREHDVVVVNINYRMGALGFMHVGHLEDGVESSVNNGIFDQICALQWTRDNIAAFGGDPQNVLIFGESAGGTSTAMLLGCPAADGLFHKAIVHSPHVDLLGVGDGHIAFTNRCIERLGGDPGKNGMRTLRSATVEQLLALMEPDIGAGEASLGLRTPDTVSFSPAIDGALIPAQIADTVRARGAANVPFLGGGCRHEGTLFAQIAGAPPHSEETAIALFEASGFDGQRALAAYGTVYPDASVTQHLAYALTDTMFRNSMVRILDAAAESGATCWSWMCTYESDLMGGFLGATHAIELGFLWNWIASDQGMGGLAGSNPPLDLGIAMRHYWANFAHTGKPFAKGEPEWPTYDVAERSILILDSREAWRETSTARSGSIGFLTPRRNRFL